MDNFVLILYLIYTKFATEKYNLPKQPVSHSAHTTSEVSVYYI